MPRVVRARLRCTHFSLRVEIFQQVTGTRRPKNIYRQFDFFCDAFLRLAKFDQK